MKNKKQNKNQIAGPIFRQGDVLLVPVAEIPEGLKKTHAVTLALGEVTGHHHTIHKGAVGYGATPQGLAEYVEVVDVGGADLTHQEHDTIQIPPGKYESVIQVEHTPEAVRQVAD